MKIPFWLNINQLSNNSFFSAQLSDENCLLLIHACLYSLRNDYVCLVRQPR